MIRVWLLCWLLAVPALSARTVSLLTTQPPEIAEPILKRFTEETGVEVRAAYLPRTGNPAAETTADVLWEDGELLTALFAKAGRIASASVTNFAHRQRQLVIRSQSVTNDFVPLTLADLTNSLARGQVALADPLAGSDFAHQLALRERWGTEAWRTWCRALAAVEPQVVRDSAEVVRRVAEGRALVGLADSDAIHAAQRAGLKVMALNFGAEDGLTLRHHVALAAGVPASDGAQRLVAHLRSAGTLEHLVRTGAAEFMEPDDGGEDLCGGAGMIVPASWTELLPEQDETLAELSKIFRR